MSQFAIYTQPSGNLIADYSSRADGLSIATNEHGFAEASGEIPMGLHEAFQLYDRAPIPYMQISNEAATAMYQGRLEDVMIAGDHVNVRAYGYSRSLSDAPYTALWSASSTAAWQALNRDDRVDAFTAERYESDTNNRLFIAPQKNGTFGTTTVNKAGFLGYRIPHGSSRQIVGISFDFTFVGIDANWVAGVQTADSAWGGGAAVFSKTSTAGTQTFSVNATFTANDALLFFLYRNAGDAVFTGETGDIQLKITNVRAVTSTANRINITFTAARAAGANVTATCTSTARMYVGQKLNVSNVAGTVTETVTILSIGSSTQFNATFVSSYASGDFIAAHMIYADEIAKDLISVVSTLNPTQVSASTGLVQSPGIDLLSEVYEDRLPSDILDYLIGLGDNQATPRQWEWGVWEERRLHFRPRGTGARSWFVDISDLQIERTLSQLYNSVYATYQEASGRTLRTAATADSASVARYGLTRRQQIDADTTSAAQAGVQQAAALSDGKDPIPRAGLAFDAIYDSAGARWPLYMMRSGDQVTIRNLPPTLSGALDRIRTFRIVRTLYDVIANTIQVEPESPLPTLAAMLAQQAVRPG